MTFNLQISQQTADCISNDLLRSSLQMLREDIHSIESKTQLEPYETEDLANWKQLEQAFMTVIKYYTTEDEWHLI